MTNAQHTSLLLASLLLLANCQGSNAPDAVFAAAAALSVPPPGSQSVRQGTGFYVGGNGLLLTVAHVVDGCGRIDLVGAGGSIKDASVLRRDPAADVALVFSASGAPFPVLKVAHRAPPGSGRLLVMGYPDNQRGSNPVPVPAVTMNRLARANNASVPGTETGLILRANIRHGDSGGPVLDESGAVVGIVRGVLSSPAEVAQLYGINAGELAVGPGLAPILKLIGGMQISPGLPAPAEAAVVRVLCWN
jgi:S1-C subfamily serine protease